MCSADPDSISPALHLRYVVTSQGDLAGYMALPGSAGKARLPPPPRSHDTAKAVPPTSVQGRGRVGSSQELSTWHQLRVPSPGHLRGEILSPAAERNFRKGQLTPLLLLTITS